MKQILIALFFVASIANGFADTLKPFSSDGCSSFPDGTFEQQQLWLSCCTEHDKAYWRGGSYQQRLDADLQLKECVSSVGEPVISELMLSGVRIGGSPYWPTAFRWGYGWPYPHGYQSPEQGDKTMPLFVILLISIITLLHGYFLVLEMFFWDKPLGRKTFNLSNDYAKASKTLAANQGLYNGFLAAGLIWGLLLGPEGIAILLFFLSCITIAGIYGGLTANKRIFFIQAVPAILALSLLLM